MTKGPSRSFYVKSVDRTQPPIEVRVEAWEMLYEKEFTYLLELLVQRTLEPLLCSFEDGGKVAVIRMPDAVVARVSIHVKGQRKRQTCFAVRLGQEFKAFEAWFQLAFLGYKVSFRKPILYPRTSWINEKTPRWP